MKSDLRFAISTTKLNKDLQFYLFLQLMYLPNQIMHILEGGSHVVKPLVAIVSN